MYRRMLRGKMKHKTLVSSNLQTHVQHSGKQSLETKLNRKKLEGFQRPQEQNSGVVSPRWARGGEKFIPRWSVSSLHYKQGDGAAGSESEARGGTGHLPQPPAQGSKRFWSFVKSLCRSSQTRIQVHSYTYIPGCNSITVADKLHK